MVRARHVDEERERERGRESVAHTSSSVPPQKASYARTLDVLAPLPSAGDSEIKGKEKRKENSEAGR